MASKQMNEMFRNDLYTPDAPLDIAIDWINENMEPGEVFYNQLRLEKWALDNGYVKKSDCPF